MSQKVKGYMLLVYKNMEDRPQMSRVIRYWMIDLIEMTRLSRDTGKILWLSSKLRLAFCALTRLTECSGMVCKAPWPGHGIPATCL